MARPRIFDYDVAYRMYLDGLSPKNIGLLLGVSHRTVEVALCHMGLTIKDKGRATYEKWAEILTAKPGTGATVTDRAAGA